MPVPALRKTLAGLQIGSCRDVVVARFAVRGIQSTALTKKSGGKGQKGDANRDGAVRRNHSLCASTLDVLYIEDVDKTSGDWTQESFPLHLRRGLSRFVC